MGKLNQNFIMFKGDDLPIDFLHVGPFFTTQGQVIGLQPTDDAEWRLYEVDDPTTVYITKTKIGGHITFYQSGYNGSIDDVIRVQLTGTDTTSMTEGEYEHQLLIKYGGTDNIVVASGTVTLKERA